MGVGSIRFLGFPNEVGQAYTVFSTVDSAYDPAGMEIQNLGTEEPTRRARRTTLEPRNTRWAFGTSSIPRVIDGFALINHNVNLGGQVRFVGAETGILDALGETTIVHPNTIVSSSNASGSVTDVDEDITLHAADGLFMFPTDSSAGWSVKFKWPTLTGTINTADDMMCVVAAVRRGFSGAGATSPLTLPKCTVALEAPSFDLGYRGVTVTTTGGQIFIWPFKRSNFTSVSDFQVSFTFTEGLSLSGWQYAVLETVALYYEVPTSPTPLAHDSGWIDVVGSSVFPSPVEPTRSIHYFPEDGPWEDILGYGIMIRSDQALHNPLTTDVGRIPAGVIPRDPDSFIQAGVACVGTGLQLENGIVGYGAPRTTVDVTEVVGQTGGLGITYGIDAFRGRVSGPITLFVTRDELLFIQDQIAWRRGRSGAFYVAMEPAATLAKQLFSAFWCTVKSVSEPEWAGNQNGIDMYTITMEFQEKI